MVAARIGAASVHCQGKNRTRRPALARSAPSPLGPAAELLPGRPGNRGLAERGGADRGAVEIRAAGGHQPELPAEADEMAALLAGVLGVVALDAVEQTLARQLADQRLRLGLEAGMGHDGHAAGPVD